MLIALLDFVQPTLSYLQSWVPSEQDDIIDCLGYHEELDDHEDIQDIQDIHDIQDDHRHQKPNTALKAKQDPHVTYLTTRKKMASALVVCLGLSAFFKREFNTISNESTSTLFTNNVSFYTDSFNASEAWGSSYLMQSALCTAILSPLTNHMSRPMKTILNGVLCVSPNLIPSIDASQTWCTLTSTTSSSTWQSMSELPSGLGIVGNGFGALGNSNVILSELDTDTGSVKHTLELDMGGSEFIMASATDQHSHLWGAGYTAISGVQYPIFVAMNSTGGIEHSFKITNLAGSAQIKGMIRKLNESFFRAVGQVGNPSKGLYLKVATNGTSISSQSLSVSGSDVLTSISEVSDGGTVIAGYTVTPTKRAWVTKLDENDVPLFTRLFSATSDALFNACTSQSDNTIMCVGTAGVDGLIVFLTSSGDVVSMVTPSGMTLNGVGFQTRNNKTTPIAIGTIQATTSDTLALFLNSNGTLASYNASNGFVLSGSYKDYLKSVSASSNGFYFSGNTFSYKSYATAMVCRADSGLDVHLDSSVIPTGLTYNKLHRTVSSQSISYSNSTITLINLSAQITPVAATVYQNSTTVWWQQATSNAPTIMPSSYPTSGPSGWPSSYPSWMPSVYPSSYPTSGPSRWPSSYPSWMPSGYPSSYPTSGPSGWPSSYPSWMPSGYPSSYPTSGPSSWPSSYPSWMPSVYPSSYPTSGPSSWPSSYPSWMPSGYPSSYPTSGPSSWPSSYPSWMPSGYPSSYPTSGPSSWPSSYPSWMPSVYPSSYPTSGPSSWPSSYPTWIPSGYPSSYPTWIPSVYPSSYPTSGPSGWPSSYPSWMPSVYPSSYPTWIPSVYPSSYPTSGPSSWPSSYPTWIPSGYPSFYPTSYPSSWPSRFPSWRPTKFPTRIPTRRPTKLGDTVSPTVTPTNVPTMGQIANWTRIEGMSNIPLSVVTTVQNFEYIFDIINAPYPNEAAIVRMCEKTGECHSFYLPWNKNYAALSQGNNLYITGADSNHFLVLAKIDIDRKQLEWVKICPSDLYKGVSLSSNALGNIKLTMQSSTSGNIWISELDKAGDILSSYAYMSASSSPRIIANAQYSIPCLDNSCTYIAGSSFNGNYNSVSIILAKEEPTYDAELYQLSAINQFDQSQAVAMIKAINNLYMIGKHQKFYSISKLLMLGNNSLVMEEGWPKKTSTVLNDMVIIPRNDRSSLIMCGSSSRFEDKLNTPQLIVVELDLNGTILKGLRVKSANSLSCKKLTKTPGGFLVSAQYNENGRTSLIFTAFVDQETFMPAPLPFGFSATFENVLSIVQFELSDLVLKPSIRINNKQNGLLEYQEFMGDRGIFSIADFKQYYNVAPTISPSSFVPTQYPSFRPSRPRITQGPTFEGQETSIGYMDLPTEEPTQASTEVPTQDSTDMDTSNPTLVLVHNLTARPTTQSTYVLSIVPTRVPSPKASLRPSFFATKSSFIPTLGPNTQSPQSERPTVFPTIMPTLLEAPSQRPAWTGFLILGGVIVCCLICCGSDTREFQALEDNICSLIQKKKVKIAPDSTLMEWDIENQMDAVSPDSSNRMSNVVFDDAQNASDAPMNILIRVISEEKIAIVTVVNNINVEGKLPGNSNENNNQNEIFNCADSDASDKCRKISTCSDSEVDPYAAISSEDSDSEVDPYAAISSEDSDDEEEESKLIVQNLTPNSLFNPNNKDSRKSSADSSSPDRDFKI